MEPDHLNKLSCSNSRIDVKLVENDQVVSEEKLFNMILYTYTAKGKGKITNTE